jgi:AraC-like DNA-binding protein
MDIAITYMDNLFKHLAPSRRRFPSGLPVESVGWIPLKISAVGRGFTTINFSFIVKGHGQYVWAGQRRVIEAPCVLMQWPGETFSYGPTAGTTWSELFVVYSEKMSDELSARGLFESRRPVWNIVDASSVLGLLERILLLARHKDVVRSVDWLDRLCEQMIVASLMDRDEPEPPDRLAVIRIIADSIRHSPGNEYDFPRIAGRSGMSISTFRRRWLDAIGVPPSTYLVESRMREARRMLVETLWSVGEIADRVGYPDPLYFSRCFRATTGVSPRGYRERHSAPL